MYRNKSGNKRAVLTAGHSPSAASSSEKSEKDAFSISGSDNEEEDPFGIPVQKKARTIAHTDEDEDEDDEEDDEDDEDDDDDNVDDDDSHPGYPTPLPALRPLEKKHGVRPRNLT